MLSKKNNLNIFENNQSSKKTYIIISIILLLMTTLIIGILIYKKETSLLNLQMVSGTEYISGEEGQIIVRFQDNLNKPITNAKCSVSLLYPDKTFVFIDKKMKPTSIPGNYYYSFIVPSSEGIYEEHTRCITSTNDENIELNISDSFHVSTGLNLVVEIAKNQKEQYNNIVKTINNNDEDLQSEILQLKNKIDNLEKQIDSNVTKPILNINKNIDKDLDSKLIDLKEDIDKDFKNINQNLKDIDENIDDKLIDFKKDINLNLKTEFSDLFNKFKESANLISNIFSN